MNLLDNNDFHRFLSLLRRFGIPYRLVLDVPEAVWGAALKRAGFMQITSAECVVVCVGHTEFLFARGPVAWKGVKQEPLEPVQAYLMSRDPTDGKISARTYYDSQIMDFRSDCVGFEALLKQDRLDYPAASRK